MTQTLINIFVPLIAAILIPLILPPFLVLNLVRYMTKFICIEDVRGKVVLITGASSGIGEHMAYEYGRRGARLALVARRVDRLQAVANKAREMGSPDVLTICSDVSKVEDCKQFVDETIRHFGECKVDHLVNNAGVSYIKRFEDIANISDVANVMDINFWGSVYATYFAVPHLRKSKGKIVVISSGSARIPLPRLSIYAASKAALIRLYETLRMEFGSHIGITIVTPGFVESEMTQCMFRSKDKLAIAVESTEECAKAIVNSACYGDKYLTEPSWVRVSFLFKVLCPEVVDWFMQWLMIHRLRNFKKEI